MTKRRTCSPANNIHCWMWYPEESQSKYPNPALMCQCQRHRYYELIQNDSVQGGIDHLGRVEQYWECGYVAIPVNSFYRNLTRAHVSLGLA
jgi:hypothetical protein